MGVARSRRAITAPVLGGTAPPRRATRAAAARARSSTRRISLSNVPGRGEVTPFGGTLDDVPLSAFTPTVRDWFERSFAEPTPAQAQAWPAIATGEHVLISAPDRLGQDARRLPVGPRPALARTPADHTRLVYVSPLKALAYDVDRNLRAPLRGIGADLTVGIRTGDTPQRDRMAMRRTPPDILITTPESLYLVLTSQARDMLRGVEAVIVDEIHAVAGTKRGAHLALTLERLAGAAGGRTRSAAHRPERDAEPARGGRAVHGRPAPQGDDRRHRACASRWTCASRCPVESMVEPEQSTGDLDPLDPLVGGESTRKSIWPAIYPELLELVRAHRSTIVFVNNRRGAERLALRLNELANADLPDDAPPREIARAHHGSLAREERTVVEELLKAGELPCLVATSSLELGIDMGAVDLVLQVESPKSVARGLQRIGRAGHNVGDVSKGRIFPKFRADLLESAVVAKLMREGRIEPTVVPRNPLDVLAQQVVAIAACAEPEPVAVGRPLRARHAHALLRRALARAARERPRHARRPLPVPGVRRAAPADRVGPRGGDDPRAQGRAPARGDQRRDDPRPRACSPSCCPTAGASASSTRRWSTRRGPGRRSCSAPRRGGSRTSGATA